MKRIKKYCENRGQWPRFKEKREQNLHYRLIMYKIEANKFKIMNGLPPFFIPNILHLHFLSKNYFSFIHIIHFILNFEQKPY